MRYLSSSPPPHCSSAQTHQTDARRLERAQEDVRNELGARGREEVDRGLVVPRSALSDRSRDVDLEELDTAKLEPALDKVAHDRGAEACGEGASTLLSNDRAEAANHAFVVLDRVELDPSLDDVNGAKRAVRHCAAEATRERSLEEVGEVERSLLAGESGDLVLRACRAGARGGKGGSRIWSVKRQRQ